MNITSILKFLYNPGHQRTLMAAVAAFSVAGSVSAATIGMNFLRGAGGDVTGVQNTLANSLLATDTAGVEAYAQANWNNFGFQGTNVAVLDSAGAATTVAVSWTSPNAWSQGGGSTPAVQASSDANLMNSYLDSLGNANVAISSPYNLYTGSSNNKPLVYLTGLGAWMASQGAQAYDLVIYSDADATSGRIGEYWAVNATGTPDALMVGTDVTTHVFVCDIQNFISNPVYFEVPLSVQPNAMPGVSGQFMSQYGNFPGNYTVLRSLTNDTVLLRSQRINTRAPINALQVVPRATILPATIYAMVDAKVYAGGKARFCPVVGGGAPLTFQWLRDGSPLTDGGNITGSTTANLTVSSVSSSDVAAYSLVVSNALGTVTSSPAQLTVVSPTANSYPQKVATDSPYAYWRFNETEDPSSGFAPAYDAFGGFTATYGMASQNGYVGQVGPTPTDWPGFEAGNFAYASSRPSARWIAGATPASAYLMAPPLLLNTNTATFMAWIYPTAAQGGFTGLLFTRGADVAGFGYGNNNMLGYTWNSNNAATYNFVSSLVPRTNEWNFVALTIAPSNAILYCYNTAGQLSATNSITHSNQFWGGPTFIGVDPNSITAPQGRGFVGSIDEVAIFNRTLSQAEIYNYYKKGLGLTAIGPSLTSQPRSLALFEGRTAKFSVTASGDTPLSYRWRKNGIALNDVGNISGSATPSLTISNVSISADSATYDVEVRNIVGPLLSSPATLTVVTSNSAPTAYETALRAAAPVAYWRLNEASGSLAAFDYWGGNIVSHVGVTTGVEGPRSPDFVGMESDNAAASYDGLTAASSSTLSLLSDRAQFSVVGWFNSPSQDQQNRAGLFGQNDVCEFGFHGAVGSQTVGVWTPRAGAYLSVTNIVPGQWYLIAAVGSGDSINMYLVSTNNGGTVLQASTAHTATTNYGSSLDPFRIGGGGILDASDNFFTGQIDEVAVFDRALSANELSDLLGAALVGGELAPTISVPPASETQLYEGRNFMLSATVIGKNLHYQWRKAGQPISDGGNISGTTSNVLRIAGVLAANAGDYDLVITNAAGAVTSQVARLTVVIPTSTYESMAVSYNPVAYWRLNDLGDPLTNAPAVDFCAGLNGSYGIATLNGYNLIAGPRPVDGFSVFESGNAAVQTVNATANGYVTMPALGMTTDTITITAWINPSAYVDRAGIVFARAGQAATGLNFIGTGNLNYHWMDTDTTYNWNSGLTVPTNQWSFVALVVQPTQATMHLLNTNGAQSAVNAVTHAARAFSDTIRIGGDPNGDARTFAGSIDEVAIFNAALTPTQIHSLYLGAPLVSLNVQQIGGNVVLTWPQGTLLSADEVTGPYVTNSVTSPYTNSPAGKKFYRVIVK